MSDYDAVLSQFGKALNTLTALLKKAESTPNSADLLGARIHPTMLPLNFQIYEVTNIPAQVAARANGTEVPEWATPKLEFKLESFASAYARIEQSKAALAKVDKEIFSSRSQTAVEIPFSPIGPMSVAHYVHFFALPNLFFHLTTAYDILRKEGVDIGKKDFLGPFLRS